MRHLLGDLRGISESYPSEITTRFLDFGCLQLPSSFSMVKCYVFDLRCVYIESYDAQNTEKFKL